VINRAVRPRQPRRHPLPPDLSERLAQFGMLEGRGIGQGREARGNWPVPSDEDEIARAAFGEVVALTQGNSEKALATVDERHGVPRVSLLTAAALTLVVSVWAARRDDGLDVLVSVVDVGALAAFTLLHASVVGYFVVRRKGAARLAHRIVPIAGAVVTIAVLLAASVLAKIVALVWLAVGVLVLAWRGVDGRSYPGAAMRCP